MDGDDDGVGGRVEVGVAGGVGGDEAGGGEVAEQVAAFDVAGGGLVGGGVLADQAVIEAQADVVAAPPALEGRPGRGWRGRRGRSSGRPSGR